MVATSVGTPGDDKHEYADLSARLAVTEVALPFEVPDTVEAKDWLMELDFVDLDEGSLEELEILAFKAPSESAKYYLLGWVGSRRNREIQTAGKVAG